MSDWGSSSRRSGGGRSHRRQASVEYGHPEEEDSWSAVNGGGGGGGGEYAAPRMIPRSNPAATEPRPPHRSSAPVNVPDWSKFYGKKKSTRNNAEGGPSSGPWAEYQRENWAHNEDEGEEEEDEEDGFVPPHEWIARKLSRTQISSSSMCEGMGRTLKGRDLSKVRNSILTKTGFLE